MVKRHGRSGFMANAHVYPGGKLDERDANQDNQGFCVGLTQDEALAAFEPLGDRLEDDETLSPGQALGLFVAAVRESFEEAGVLLARTQDGHLVNLDDPAGAERYQGYRERLQTGDMSMKELVDAEGLQLDLHDLVYFAHWITPVVERRRFNTRFFVARAPNQQTPLHDDRETVESDWMRPSEALKRYDRGEIQLAPPTLRTLEDLAVFSNVDTMLAGLRAAPVPTILPRFEQLDGDLTLLLPGDPLYPSDSPVEGPTRVQLQNGRWWSKSPSQGEG